MRIAVSVVVALSLLTLLIACLLIGRQFQNDLDQARARAARGSVMAQTRCGAIEYQEAGTGVPLLMIHGSGGGHDQAWPSHTRSPATAYA